MAIAVWTSFEQITNSNGVPHTAVEVNVYAAGTVTPLDVFSDTGLSTSADNPIECDAFGQHSMRYIEAASYKTVVTALVNGVRVTLNSWSKDNIDPGVPLGSGALAVEHGGTGSTTPEAALAALGGATAAELADVSAEVASLSGTLGSTERTHIATGSTAQRPTDPVAGDIRHNTTETKYEGYISGGWDNFALEAANSASTSQVSGETAGALFVRADRLINSSRVAQVTGKVTYSGGVPTLVDSIGVSGITDTGVGQLTVTMSPAMANTNYALIGMAEAAASSIVCTARSITTSTFLLVMTNLATGNNADPDSVSFAVFKN